ncbi:MAG: hypothetical protein ABJE95_04525 [Byssovorax sp.]
MSTFELVVEQVRAVAGADFAFVLTRRGRLVTRDAPRDMPESGRETIVEAARTLDHGETGELTVPRQELVPYGGAAPIDVHFGVAADQAILCVVMSSWVGKAMVSEALKDGVAKIEAVIAASGREPMRRRKSQMPPPMDRATAGLVTASGATTHAARSLERSPVIQRAPSRPPPRLRVSSLPEITVGTTDLGRESLAAIERELLDDATRGASSPQITVDEAELGRESLAAIDREVRGKHRGSAPRLSVGEATLGRESLAAIASELRGKKRGSAPLITLGEAALGRESLAAIELEDSERPSGVRLATRPPATSMPETLHIELENLDELDIRATPNPDSPRATQPWVELPEDTKRALDAESLGRKLMPPRLTLKLEDADTDVFEAARLDPAAQPRAPAAKRRK